MPAGQKILHHRSDVLETVVLINPSDEAVSTEVGIQLAVCRAGPHPVGRARLSGGTGQVAGEGHGTEKFLIQDAGSSQFSVSAPLQTALVHKDNAEENSRTGILHRGQWVEVLGVSGGRAAGMGSAWL